MNVTPDASRRILNRTGSAVAILLVLLLGAAVGALIHFDIPKDNHDILLVLVTVIANSVTGVVGYFFGSSVERARQGEIIATQAITNDTLARAQAAAGPQSTTTTTIRSETAVTPPTVAPVLVKPAWVVQETWDVMTDEQRIAIVAKGRPQADAGV